jgi:hypothetical protein
VLSADILNHFVVKDIKIFACLNDFFVILIATSPKPAVLKPTAINDSRKCSSTFENQKNKPSQVKKSQLHVLYVAHYDSNHYLLTASYVRRSQTPLTT